MNRAYELGFIIPISVLEADTQAVIATVRAWIEELGGEIRKVDYWGRRRMAYTIKDYREGYYVFLQMDFPPLRLNELEYNLRLSEQVLRHLVVRLDED